MDKIKCSVPILTLNSGKYLVRCLESVKDFDDVFLVDGNSIDNTLIVAKHYGIPIYKQTDSEAQEIVISNFTEIRKKSIGFARNEWVLILDSDEYLTPELIEEIREVLADKSFSSSRVFRIQKKYCIGSKSYDYAFNYPNYSSRLFNRNSGVGYREGKIVHEKIYVPRNVKIIDLNNWIYSELPESFFAGIEKDKHQLTLMKASTFITGSFKGREHSFKMGFVYFVRSVKILFKSLLVYFKHGYDKSLPIGQVLRHIRVHLIMSWWKLYLALFGNKNNS